MIDGAAALAQSKGKEGMALLGNTRHFVLFFDQFYSNKTYVRSSIPFYTTQKSQQWQRMG